MENSLRFEFSLRSSWPKWNLHRSEFHYAQVMWTVIKKLPHTEVKFYSEVKSQTGLSSLRVSCKHVISVCQCKTANLSIIPLVRYIFVRTYSCFVFLGFFGFIQKPKACNFIKNEAVAQLFPCEFCEISKYTFLIFYFKKLRMRRLLSTNNISNGIRTTFLSVLWIYFFE